MSNLLAMSFEGEINPSFELRCLLPGAKKPDGWGLGYYPKGEPAASVLKESAAAHSQLGTQLVKAWDHLASSTFVVHIRNAIWGALTDANTQPFARTWGGREWLFAHSGSLNERPARPEGGYFDPVGSTDSERVFCELLARIAGRGWKDLSEVDPAALAGWLSELNALGTLNVVLTDGRDLCVWSDQVKGGIHLCYVFPPYQRLMLGDADVQVNLARAGHRTRKGVVVSTSPMALDSELAAQWLPLPPGHLLILRQGAVRMEVARTGSAGVEGLAPTHRRQNRPTRAEPKQLRVRHRTVYRYKNPVERSVHLLRLVPMHDRLQRVRESELTASVEGHQRDFEDVFGNQTRRLQLETPFHELAIEASSLVELLDTDPFSFRSLRVGSSIPLVWMPWQQQLLNPYLLPPELPETELVELTEYAMSFVERNDYDLLDTLMDLNATLFKEYRYSQGITTLATTAFNVYQQRCGVCQDFANLFICLARLLGVPARYTCGYVYAGPTNPNQRMAEASHAWVQVYLPEVGWKGFDPTNGTMTQTDHVRVAVGRNYSDATPTSGTLYAGGGNETLEVFVRVEPVS